LREPVAKELVANVDLLCLDAGNTVIFLDHDRLADILREAIGFDVPARVLVDAEGEAKRRAETGDLFDVAWTHRARPGAGSWGRNIGTLALAAGLPAERVGALLDHAWRHHEERNLYSKVPAGLGAALDEARGRGVKVAIVSNSEGMLDALFVDLGIRGHFDLVVDSGRVGVEKPDPRIFAVALEHFGVPAARALHLGDFYATDIVGARAAGVRCALVDPFAHYAGRHPDVPRVAGVVEVARAM
jgi:HAD superfamily hydrolase (TIGR01509 family)